MEEALGIDLGTTNMVVAALVDGNVEVLCNDVGNRSTPSCVHFNASGGREVGLSALRHVISEPDSTVLNVLRIVGTPWSECITDPAHPQGFTEENGYPTFFMKDGTSYTPGEVIQVLFQEAKKTAALNNVYLKRAVLTVPTYFNAIQRSCVQESAKAAGFDQVTIINDTSATAVVYASMHEEGEARTVLVVSVGGGGSSICVAKIISKRVTIIAKSAKKLPGGADFDHLMTQHIIQTTGGDLCQQSIQIIKSCWIKTKEVLSRIPSTTFGPLFIPSLGRDLEMVISRSEFEVVCESLFREISDEIINVLHKAKVPIYEVDVVLGAGASMRIPALQSAILTNIGKEMYKANHLDEDCAKGAALMGSGFIFLNEAPERPAPSHTKVFRPWSSDSDQEEKQDTSGEQSKDKEEENMPKSGEKVKDAVKDENDDNSGSENEDEIQQSIDLNAVLAYRQGKGYPASMKGNKNAKSNFRRQAKPFHYNPDLQKLFYMRAPRKSAGKYDPLLSREIVFDRHQQLKLVKDLHEGSDTSLEANALSSHRGRDKLVDILTERYYWIGMYSDARQHCKQCITCSMMNPSCLKVSDELHPVPVPPRPMAQVGIDIASLPEVDSKKYMCVAICYFTKYSEARALSTKSAPEVALFLYEDVICRHGCPETFISDQGREFCNQLMSELFRLTGARQRVTSPYHPQANGLVERQNRTIKNSFLKVLQPKIDQWPKILQGALFAHRVSVHASTKFSPFFLMYRRHPRLPAELAKEREGEETSSEEDCDDPPALDSADEEEAFDCNMFRSVFEPLCEVQEAINQAALDNIKKAQQRQKVAYDKRHSGGQPLFVGQSVMLLNAPQRDRKGGKDEMPKSGPYTIVDISAKKKVTLKNARGLVLKTKYASALIIPVGQPKPPKRKRQLGDSSKEQKPNPGTDGKYDKKEDSTPDGEDDKEDSRPDIKDDKKEEDDKEEEDDTDESGSRPGSPDMNNPPDDWLFNPPPKAWREEKCKELKIKIKDPNSLTADVHPKPLRRATKTQPIRGDGNCFFRSLAYILTGSESQHCTIRRKLVAFMQADKCSLRYTGCETGALYVRQSGMGNLGIWATDAEIRGAARWLNIDIYIELEGKWQRFCHTGNLDGEMSANSLFILNENGTHYCVVLDVQSV